MIRSEWRAAASLSQRPTNPNRGFLTGLLSLVFSVLILCSSGRQADTDLSEALSDLDSKSSTIKTLHASFRQIKHSDILRRPLVSSGSVRMSRDRVRWDTRTPAASVLVASKDDVRIFYPDLSVLEIYALGDQMSQLAGSPVFRLARIQRFFTIESDLRTSARGFMQLQLTPRTEELKKHLKSIRLGVHVETGLVREVVMFNADDEKTEMFFDDVRTNAPIAAGELEIVAPEGVRVVHPLGEDGSPTASDQEVGP